MNETQAFEQVKQALKPKRFEHTIRVVTTAEKLQNRFGGNLEVIRMAAILHDYAKYRPVEEMKQEVRANDELPLEILDYGEEILHAFVGSVYLKKELQVTDNRILDAVSYHTTGRAGMTLEEKIVFLADYIEPGRTFKQAALVREIAEKNLNQACFTSLGFTIQFLAGKGLPIYPDTFIGYNDLYKQI
ncbi:bis(5'-nucleosyl)-tetraphosphatase (symmetrical) YqeK [Salisediminibacterium beveridgei]|uniref:bis(5'-nucleosyl)-tetraphosphatase (symmetrical) n=1 Tax=Salisediminibacterium beveridgei TaxID=632773 RepID=A0A1D7QU67_9BACI|nr:bis(5'-nucleosyl)-tetraphosphatase (symmetrical) YqeK [Salisediminibacterium beveridgei]AOM82566.1 Hydrolase (HAD superfamily), YqeK [Salisediminibacterium beveridgei]